MTPAGPRYFTSYSGVRLPLRLVGPLEEEETRHRNTFIRAHYDDDGRLVRLEKTVYGQVVLAHVYTYHQGGGLMRADIHVHDDEDEHTSLEFDEAGAARV